MGGRAVSRRKSLSLSLLAGKKVAVVRAAEASAAVVVSKSNCEEGTRYYGLRSRPDGGNGQKIAAPLFSLPYNRLSHRQFLLPLQNFDKFAPPPANFAASIVTLPLLEFLPPSFPRCWRSVSSRSGESQPFVPQSQMKLGRRKRRRASDHDDSAEGRYSLRSLPPPPRPEAIRPTTIFVTRTSVRMSALLVCMALRLGASRYDVHKMFRFFDPLPLVRIWN